MGSYIERYGKRWYPRQDGYYCDSRGRLLHREVYAREVGELPSGRTHHVDHVDGDKSNNDPDNLQAIRIKDHVAKHGNVLQQPHAKAAQRVANARVWAERKPQEAVCIVCESVFMHRNTAPDRVRFCSQKCYMRDRSRRKVGNEYRDADCVICGNQFRSRWNATLGAWGKTCNRSCTATLAYRSRRANL